jgi:hypothetical protein
MQQETGFAVQASRSSLHGTASAHQRQTHAWSSSTARPFDRTTFGRSSRSKAPTTCTHQHAATLDCPRRERLWKGGREESDRAQGHARGAVSGTYRLRVVRVFLQQKNKDESKDTMAPVDHRMLIVHTFMRNLIQVVL